MNADLMVYAPLLVPLLVAVLGYWMWRAWGRDPEQGSIMVRWEPPPGLTAAEGATVIDHKPHYWDLASILTELALSGYLVIEEREAERLLGSGTDYVFHVIRPEQEWTELRTHQRFFLEHITRAGKPAGPGPGPGSRKAYHSVRLPGFPGPGLEGEKIQAVLLGELVRKGHYRFRPDRARWPWHVGAFALLLASYILAQIPPAELGGVREANVITGATFATCLLFFFFGFIMAATTKKGGRARDAVLGFKRFVEQAGRPRYRQMIESPDRFEEYLPWAVAFRCLEDWAKPFEDLVEELPDWYEPLEPTHSPTAFAARLRKMVGRIVRALEPKGRTYGSALKGSDPGYARS